MTGKTEKVSAFWPLLAGFIKIEALRSVNAVSLPAVVLGHHISNGCYRAARIVAMPLVWSWGFEPDSGSSTKRRVR